MNRTLKAMAAMMLMMVFAVGCTKPEGPNNGGNNNGQNDSIVNPSNNGENDSIADNSGTLNGHDYVDLGLPSGALWATCNVGADSIADYGDFFAWGETSPKETYNWENYNYYDYAINVLTKYCVNDWNTNSGYYGQEDMLVVLEAVDDAATVNWGDSWRTPTCDEWRELRDNCLHEFTTRNGVNGHLFKSPNGNSIFIPVRPSYCDCYGEYWSSSLYIEEPRSAYRFYFTETDYKVSVENRYRAGLVRPVCSGE
jgi:hypothetical protein